MEHHPFYQERHWTGWVDLYWKASKVRSDKLMFKNISPNYSGGGMRSIMGNKNES